MKFIKENWPLFVVILFFTVAIGVAALLSTKEEPLQTRVWVDGYASGETVSEWSYSWLEGKYYINLEDGRHIEASRDDVIIEEGGKNYGN